ncbi:hypothetical protein E3J68_01145 [Candidatus Aerophobetes bacterium]|uniref:LytR/CpsA/Psr regulator C-terminal domain-containing protein n=1 Tax=Aerophobetes bacterium TaxID=2030807 RepID=A0A523TI38_UNCAE|nr:MAG: hypothetical protein E3J68_01145 [Candidatus Aerophobetes bacterium]
MKTYTMTRRAKFIVLGLIAACLLISTNPVTATTPVTVKEIQNVKIEGHFFTTTISNSQRTIYAKDASEGRYLVLVLSATLQKGEGKIFAPDFTLRYFHDDESEDRSRCVALTVSKTTAPEKLFDLDEFVIGDFCWIKVNSGQNRFALACYIEPDVKIIDLYQLGIAEPLTYHIGTDRLYSVYICTNIDTKTLLRAKEVIQKGNYNVIDVSETLIKEETGITIHYREQAESQAREISQRLMTEFGKAPTLQKMRLISDVDIVIWLGK